MMPEIREGLYRRREYPGSVKAYIGRYLGSVKTLKES
jgi:hypothetical protein